MGGVGSLAPASAAAPRLGLKPPQRMRAAGGQLPRCCCWGPVCAFMPAAHAQGLAPRPAACGPAVGSCMAVGPQGAEGWLAGGRDVKAGSQRVYRAGFSNRKWRPSGPQRSMNTGSRVGVTGGHLKVHPLSAGQRLYRLALLRWGAARCSERQCAAARRGSPLTRAWLPLPSVQP